MTTPKSEIDELVAQVKDENQMDTTDKLGVPLQGGVKNAAASQAETTEDDELMARLAKLRLLNEIRCACQKIREEDNVPCYFVPAPISRASAARRRVYRCGLQQREEECTGIFANTR